MYRRQGSKGVLQGVLSGPYSGGAKRIDANKLPRATRQRLADVLAARAEPSPILVDRPSGIRSRFRAAWGLVVGVLGLVMLSAIDFGDPRGVWALQPRSMGVGYVAAVALAGMSVLVLFRRRALFGGNALAPGRYLLPLDVADIPLPDDEGNQVLVVTPLGDARDAGVRGEGRRRELVVVFDKGTRATFPVRSEAAGELALRQLEHTQRLLEALTYSQDLEKAVAHDALFDIRVDASWGALAPDGPSTPPRRVSRAWIHRPLATVVVVVASGALGALGFAGRNRLSDRALYLRATHVGTIAALDAYLAQGHAYREDARGLRDRIEAQREEEARRVKEPKGHGGFDGPPRAEWELSREEANARRGTAEACIASLRARSAPEHTDVTRIMEALTSRARTTGDRAVPLRFVRTVAEPKGIAPALELDARERTTAWAFERVFSETCPASILHFVRLEEGALRESEIGLEVRYAVTWPTTWKLTPNPTHFDCDRAAPKPALVACPPGGRYVVQGMQIVFDVTLQGTRGGDVVTFRLTMPAENPPMSLRARSLFVLAGEPPSRDTFDERVYAATTARAFDRLYDEIYGLFFRGEVKVPIASNEATP